MDQLSRLKDALADRYVLERELGSGGMATVHLARDLKHERPVALKVLRPELAASLGPERFLAEIRTTARLQHPHIVALFDSGEAAGFLFYVMPFIEGEALRDRLDRDKRLDVEAMLAIARPVAEALAYAHELGVVHRDIKPENILLSRGQPFVTDFGIARAVSVAGGERLTATGLAVGTPAYMSPEQALGDEKVDPRSDIYSLGCVIYEMLSGSPPFAGATVQALLAKRLTGPPPRLTTVPAAVDEAVRRSLATAPQDRFATALALADALVEAARRPVEAELSIVILPFDDLSPATDNEYFSDGLTEEIIADLSMLDFLRVISRTSAMMFKGAKKSAPAIAQELNVRYVLEGSVRKAGNRLRITAQLIDAEADRHIWAQKFDGVLEDVFDIQEEVAGKIVEALKGRLTPEDRRQMAARPSFHEVGIYETYARARFEFWRTEPGSQEKALGLLEEAVDAYGEHPLLVAGIGAAHWQFYHYLGDLDRRHLQVVESCASKLLADDPESSAGSRLQSYLAMASGRTEEAIGHLQLAMNGDPNDTETLLWMAYILASHAGRPSLARPVADRWLAVDPLNPFASASLLWVHWGSGDAERGLRQAEEWRRRDPDDRICRFYQTIFLAWLGRHEEAWHQAEVLVQEEPDEVMGQVVRSLTLALMGRSEEALGAVSAENEAHCRLDFGLPLWVSEAYALVGKTEEALRWLNQSVRNGMFNYPLLAQADPLLDNIRSEPGFTKLMAEVKERWDAFGRGRV